MSYNVVVTQSNISGFTPTVSPDPLSSLTEESLSTELYLPSSYQGAYYSVDLTFQAVYPDGMGGNIGTADVTNVTTAFDFEQYNMSTIKVSNNVIRIFGTFVNAFPEEFFYFKLKNNSFEYLEASTDVDFKALVHYNMPSPTTVEKAYSFEVQAPTEFGGGSLSNVTHTMNQWIVWRYQPAVSAVVDLVSRGAV